MPEAVGPEVAMAEDVAGEVSSSSLQIVGCSGGAAPLKR